MCLLYQGLRGIARTFLDFFWVPRVLGPARLAEDEVSNVDDTGNEVRCGLATLPTLDGFLVFHDPILSCLRGGKSLDC